MGNSGEPDYRQTINENMIVVIMIAAIADKIATAFHP
jgi:hypothetical protein